MRRFGHAPKPGQTYLRRPGAYGIILAGSDILLTCQTAPEREMQLPGGGVDRGESPLQALHRETLEETGWRIRVDRGLGVFRRFVFMPDYGIHAEKICHVFLARAIRRLGPPSEPHHQAAWIAREVAPPLLSNAGDAFYLRQVLRSITETG